MSSNGHEVREFIIQNFLYGEDSRLEDETSFLGNNIIDSTGILELVAFLEERYGIAISDDEIIPSNLDCLKNIDCYIRRKLNGHDKKDDLAGMPYGSELNCFDAGTQPAMNPPVFPEAIEKGSALPEIAPQ